MKCRRKLNFKTEQHDSLQNNGLVPSERHIKASRVSDSDPGFGCSSSGERALQGDYQKPLTLQCCPSQLSQQNRKFEKVLCIRKSRTAVFLMYGGMGDIQGENCSIKATEGSVQATGQPTRFCIRTTYLVFHTRFLLVSCIYFEEWEQRTVI